MHTKNHNCADCAKKHLSQALVILEEILNGYKNTDHEIYLMGHLAEASSHMIDNETIASKIRTLRKDLLENNHQFSITDIDKIKDLYSDIYKQNQLIDSNVATAKQNEIINPIINTSGDINTYIVTPTGDRPIMLKILRKCIEEQTVLANWVVVDDGKTSSAPVLYGMPRLRYFTRGKNEIGNSIKEQMLALLDGIPANSNVIIMEDDDWYAPDYVESMLEGLKRGKLVGIRPYMYYSLKTKTYMIRGQRRSMSIWATTAFKSELVPHIIDVIKETKDHSIDINVWNKLGPQYGYVFEKDHMMHVGIKNAPGRLGTTGTHSKESLGAQDLDGSFLKKIVGEDYYKIYSNLFKTVDVVIPLGTGSKHANVEIRMALRSIQANFMQLGSVYVVAEELPEWMTNVVHVKCPDVSKSGKDAILINKVLEACKQSGLSENFMFWSDDQVLAKPMFIDDIKPVAATMRIETMGDTKWNKRLKNTKAFLESRGKPFQNWESHVPQPYNKSKFIEIMSAIDYDNDIGYGINTLYFNMLEEKPTINEAQCKLTLEGGKLCCGGIPKSVQSKTWIGYNDNGLQNGLLDYLHKTFSKPSKFEKIYDTVSTPQTISIPQTVFNAIDIYNRKDKVLAIFPELSSYYDDIEQKKLANPNWRAGNLKRYVQPLVDEFVRKCDAINKSPHSVMV